jgi:hypothetical protein
LILDFEKIWNILQQSEIPIQFVPSKREAQDFPCKAIRLAIFLYVNSVLQEKSEATVSSIIQHLNQGCVWFSSSELHSCSVASLYIWLPGAVRATNVHNIWVVLTDFLNTWLITNSSLVHHLDDKVGFITSTIAFALCLLAGKVNQKANITAAYFLS